MWLPEEKTSMGSFESSSKSSSVSPNPPAAFSTLTIVKSTFFRSISGESARSSARRPGEPTTSPTKRMFMERKFPIPGLTGVLDRARLADHRDFDLPGILQLRLDLPRNVARQPESLVVRDPIGLDDDPQLPARLDGEGFLHPLETVGDVLELLEPLDVRLEDLPARSGPRRGERIGAVDEHRFERARLVVAVMALHRVDHVFGLAELLQDVAAELEMGSFLLAVDRLSDVVQQAGALGDLGAGAELARHARGEPRDLLRMLQDVLAVGRPVLQSPEQLDELGVKIRDRELESGRLPFLTDLFPQLRADFFDDLFDARRVDPPVDDQLFEREPGDFAPDRLERADHDRLGSVIDDEVDAGRRFERPDVPPLAADDPSLQVVRRQLDDRDRRLDDSVGGQPLDRHADFVAGPLRRLLHRL